MYSFNKILVALDHTDLDRELVEAASFTSTLAGTTDVYFINVVKDLNIPKKIQQEFPDMLSNAVQERTRDIEKVIKEVFKNKRAKIHIEIENMSNLIEL